MFKKTDTTPQYDLFSTPSTQLGKRGSKKYDDPKAWHNQFYRNVTSKIDESIFSSFQRREYGCPQCFYSGNHRHVVNQGGVRL